jgi:hypothetical protein
MRSLVAADTGRVLLKAYDTVLSETWARVATSCMVAMSPPSSSLTVCRAAVIVPVLLSPAGNGIGVTPGPAAGHYLIEALR